MKVAALFLPLLLLLTVMGQVRGMVRGQAKSTKVPHVKSGPHGINISSEVLESSTHNPNDLNKPKMRRA